MSLSSCDHVVFLDVLVKHVWISKAASLQRNVSILSRYRNGPDLSSQSRNILKWVHKRGSVVTRQPTFMTRQLRRYSDVNAIDTVARAEQ